YWEFNFDESKASHVKGVESFISFVPQFYFQPKYSYINLDPVFFQLKDIEDVLDVLPKEIDAIYNLKNEMLYCLKDNKISGLDLKMYTFFKFDIPQLLTSIVERSKTTITDSEGIEYQKYYKIFPNFSHLKRYMIVILTK